MFELDHVVATTRSIDEACSAWERLGFTLTPRGFHPFGTVNNLVMFTSTFFELFALRDGDAFDAAVEQGTMPPDLGELTRLALETRSGPSLMALTSERLEEDLAGARDAGVRVRAPMHFKRPVTLPDGTATAADVTVHFLAAREREAPPVFVSVQHVREAVWVPAWQRHPNGALEILEVVYCADPLEPSVRHLSALLKARDDGASGNDAVFDAGPATVRVTRPQGWLQRFDDPGPQARGPATLAALVIAVADLDRLETLLGDNGVSHRRTAVSCQVERGETYGTLVEFVQAEQEQQSS